MKLEMTLPERPSFLHALPILDLLALVMLFPVLTAALAPQAGVEVELPETEFRLQRVANPIVLSVSGGSEPEYWVGKQRVEREALMSVVAERAGDWNEGGRPAVLLKVDKSAQSLGMELSFELLREGYRCLWGAKLAQ
ncbi:biopolymer transporter ExbD [Rubritalea marina]|uniref:biopolymer transporter ExbD n=1 Tax=Rubritalea marina TaxID=361055 RepID=UPI00037ED873|nr:biopolymer transporter ExbD [Rubritalea marina]